MQIIWQLTGGVSSLQEREEILLHVHIEERGFTCHKQQVEKRLLDQLHKQQLEKRRWKIIFVVLGSLLFVIVVYGGIQ